MSPIRPEDKHRYPAEWPQIRQRILERAQSDGLMYRYRCECTGECGEHLTVRCSAWHNAPIPGKDESYVVLTIAHLDHTPENCADDNLKAMCQRCHNRYDMPVRVARRRLRLLKESEEAGQGILDLRAL